MKIVQLLPTLAYGDAVGNDTVALSKLITKIGYETMIYAENIDPKVDHSIIQHYSTMPHLDIEDILIYHFSTGSEVMEKLLRNQICKKIMIYHNITPAHFFEPYNTFLAKLVQAGRDDLKKLKDLFEFCIADSHFNKEDLRLAGYTCPIAVVPILIPFSDYDKTPNEELINQYKNDGYTNILFVGRIVPNKKQENIIKAFAYYRRTINDKARLFIVGNYEGMETYYNRLRRYVDALGINAKDVIFTGHTPFADILAYYRIADVFVCMSEHEGFCVPLVEAMKFDIPIIANSAGAIPETLNGSGILIDKKHKNSVIIANLMDKIMSDKHFKQEVLKLQRERLQAFAYEQVATQTEELLKKFIGNLNYDDIQDNYVVKDNDDIKFLLDNLDETFLREDTYDESIAFEQLPVITNEEQQKVGETKRIIKKYILKPGYNGLAAISPRLADYINDGIHGVLHRIKYGSTLKDRIIIEKAEDRSKSLLLIDVTETTKVDVRTGIQRVVNNIYKNINTLDKDSLPVRAWYKKLITSEKYLDRLNKIKFEGKEREIKFVDGDKLLLLDSSWVYHKDFSHIIDKAHKKCINLNAVVYDMFPIQYPELFDSKYFVNVFETWHDMLLKKTDGVICISRTTADVVISYYLKKKFKRKKPLNIYYFHMGADIPSKVSSIREKISRFVKQGSTLLMVGTVEPRKGYKCVLEAYEKLFVENDDLQLLIIGKNGWKNDNLLKILDKDSMRKRVLWVTDAKDDELHWAYQHATALIAASKDEGFGLPIIEAAHFGLPIICSDIPIFHEVAGDNATYFKAMNSESLRDTLKMWLQQEKHPDSKNIKLYTWQDSAQEILDIINGKTTPYKILQ
jgi:glycosyltransferase involved in cell wall biosynthesis